MQPQHSFQVIRGGRSGERSWSDQVVADHSEQARTGGAPPSPNWKEDLSSAVAEISEKLEQQLRLNRLEDEVVQLAGQARSFRVTISNLFPYRAKLRKAIEANVRPSNDSWVASFFDANVHASGETEIDALDNLKGMLVDMLQSLTKIERSRLSRELQRTLEVLSNSIEIEG